MVLNRVALVGLLLGVAGLSACTTMRSIEPAAYLANNSPEVVWVTYTNDTIVAVAQPMVKRDTLRGVWPGTRQRVRIPLTQIRSIQAKVPDHTRTAILAATLGVTTVSILYIGFISQAGSHAAGTNCGLDEFGDQINVC